MCGGGGATQPCGCSGSGRVAVGSGAGGGRGTAIVVESSPSRGGSDDPPPARGAEKFTFCTAIGENTVAVGTLLMPRSSVYSASVACECALESAWLDDDEAVP